jgi:site-specific recombinase XerD
MTLDDLMRNWIEHEIIVKGCQPSSVQTYSRYLVKFFEWLDIKTSEAIQNISVHEIVAYLKHLYFSKSNLQNISRAGKLAALRSFFRYLVYMKFLKEDPTAGVPSPKIAPTIAHKFTTKELSAIFASVDVSTPYGLRDKALLYTIYGAGLRVSEVCNLELRDIIDSGSSIMLNILHSKGGKSRVIPLKSIPAKLLKEWGLFRYSSGAVHSDPVFVPIKGFAGNGRLTSTTISDILKKYARLAGLHDIRVFVHKMRATYCTDLWDSGSDRCRKCGYPVHRLGILEIAVLMGHADPKTTMRYIAISEKTLRAGAIPDSRFKEIEHFGQQQKLLPQGENE